MRKLIFGVFAILLSATMFAAPRTAEQAAQIAAEFTNSQPQFNHIRKSARGVSNLRLAHTVAKPASTEAALYVFNQPDNNGWVMISADDRTLDVLGYTDKGQFDAENVNPNLKFWLSRYAEEIANVNDENAVDHDAIKKATQATAIAPLLGDITWYQEAPYNNLLPIDKYDNTRCLTGCVATAASQIMRKWKHPLKGTGKKTYIWQNDNKSSQKETLTADYGNTTYDWDNMLPAYEGVSYTTTQATAVATLMLHAGIACDMMYGGDKAGGSGAWTDDMGYGLKTYFDYSLTKFITMYSKNKYQNAKGTSVADIPSEFSVTSSQFTSYFNADLEAGRPIIMGGEDSNGGHEFVCDGRDSNGKFHINWGWEGSGNGYFAITALKPTGTSYNFSSNIDAIIGLEPALFTVNFDAGKFGSCSTTSISQQAKGDAITLPAVTANTNYNFVGWATSANATTADAGQAGDTYVPQSTCTLYAIYSHPGYVSIAYSLVGVTKTSGVDDEIKVSDGLQAKFTAQSGYGALSADSCTVNVTIGGNNVSDCYTFNNGVLTITLTESQLTGAVIISVKGTKRAGSSFELVTNASTLSAGDELIIVSTAKSVAATNISSQVLGTESVKILNNSITLDDDSKVIILTLGGEEGNWTLTNASNQKLGATAVKKLAWGSGTTTWSISISSEDATIQNGNSTYGRILYNTGSPRFTTYISSASSTMLLPQIFARSGGSGSTPSVVAVTSVELSKSVLNLNVGNSETLTATVLPESATNKSVTWSSSNASIASVANGVVTAYSEGTATITVTTKDGNKTATCTVNVVSQGQDVKEDTIKVTSAQAATATMALSKNTTSDDLYCVTGYITYVYSAKNSTQQSFWMDDEQGSTQTFQAYLATIPDEITAFTNGLHVRVTGYLTHYVNNKKKSIPEIKNGTVEILEETPTAIDNFETGAKTAIKRIENGQLVIIMDGVKYNVFGQTIE